MKLRLTILTFLSVIFNLFSQIDNEYKDAFLEAQSYFLFEEYEEALPLFTKLLRVNPHNDNLKYLTGRCLLQNPYKYKQAIKYLEEASKNINPKYKEESYKEIRAPHDVIFYLAEAYHKDHQLEQALKYYNEFYNTMDREIYETELVEKRIESCNYAKKQIEKPYNIDFQNLGESINSFFPEENPVISGNGNVIAFTRKLKFYDAVFVSYKTENGWSNPVNIIPQLGVDGNIKTSSLNYNGDVIYIYSNDQYDGNLYYSIRKDNTWSKLIKLNENINTRFWESNAFESIEGDKLYFSSNRPGGFGRLDIYVSHKGHDGIWGPAVNLGPEINTSFNDDAPVLIKNGQILIFSSYGHTTIGDYDYFLSEKKDMAWSTPKNMGYPLNTAGEEILLSTTNDGNQTLIALSKEDSKGLNDLYIANLNISNPILVEIGNKEEKIKQEKIRIANEEALKKAQRDTFSISLDELVNNKQNTIESENDSLKISIENPDSEALALNDSLINLTYTTENKKASLYIAQKTYDISNGSTISIPLEITDYDHLTVQIYNNGELSFEKEYKINGNQFTFTHSPAEGINTIKFILSNNSGESISDIVTVNCTSLSDKMDDDQLVKNNLNKQSFVHIREVIDRLISASGNQNISHIIDSISNLPNNDLFTLLQYFLGDSYNSLSETEKTNVKELLMAILKSTGLNNLNINKFYTLLSNNSTPLIREYISGLDINKDGFTPISLLQHILNAEKYEPYSNEDISITLSNLLMKYGQENSMFTDQKNKSGKESVSNANYYLIGLFIILLILFLLYKRKKNKKEDEKTTI